MLASVMVQKFYNIGSSEKYMVCDVGDKFIFEIIFWANAIKNLISKDVDRGVYWVRFAIILSVLHL